MSFIKPLGRVLLRGQWWSTLELSVDREIGVAGPDQNPMGSGMLEATGRAVLARPVTMSDRGWDAWRHNPPHGGEPVVVEVSDDGGDTWHTKLVGEVDDSQGAIDELGMTIGLVDSTDALDRQVSISPRNFLHPSPKGGIRPMSIGLHPVWITNIVARAGGFFATSPYDPETTILSVPMMGSVTPERGELVDADTISATSATDGLPPNSPQYRSVPWGLSVSNLQARLKPYFPAGVTGRLTRSLGVRMEVGPTGALRSSVILRWPTGASIVVGASNAGVTVDVRRSDDDGIPSGYATRTRPLTDEQKSRGFSLDVWISPDGSIDTVVDGVAASHAAFVVLAGMTEEAMSEIGVYSSMAGPAIGGIVVVSTSTRAALPSWERTFLADVDPDHMIWGTPAIVKRSGLGLIREQAEAELSSMWIDEDGILRYVSRTRMDNRAPVATVSLDEAETMDWKVSRNSVFTGVALSYRKPSATRGKWASAIVWESGNDALAPGESLEEVLHPPEGEDWIDVELAVQRAAPDGSDVSAMNRGVGSWVGGSTVQSSAEGEREEPVYLSWWSASARKIDHKSYIVRVDYEPPSGTTADLAIAMPPFGNALRQYLRGRGLLLRAGARITWQDVSPVTRSTGADLPKPRVHEHDGSWWIQSEYVSNRIADRFTEMYRQPLPTHGPVEMADPDLSIRLGDTVNVNIDGITKGHRVAGISLHLDEDGLDQTLTLRQIRP